MNADNTDSTPSLDLNDIPYFLAVVEEGSLSAAARRLGVAQPTVGRRIRGMESSLNVRLFNRVAERHELTDVGQRILRAAERIRQNASVVEKRAGGSESELSGAVRITATEGFANLWLVNQLDALKEQLPEVKVEIFVTTKLTDMLRLEADIALRIGTPGSEELVGRRVAEIGFGLYASEDYLSSFGLPNATDQLSGHRIIESSGALSGVAQAELLRKVGSKAKTMLHTDSIMTQLQAASDGFGIAPLAHYVGASRGLVRVLAGDFDVNLDLWLLTHQDLRNTARVRAVMQSLSALLEQDAALFRGTRSR